MECSACSIEYMIGKDLGHPHTCGRETQSRLLAVLAEAKKLSEQPCRCSYSWTERGMHDPHGCGWEDAADLRAAIKVYEDANEEHEV